MINKKAFKSISEELEDAINVILIIAGKLITLMEMLKALKCYSVYQKDKNKMNQNNLIEALKHR